jgi:hypothetical protein
MIAPRPWLGISTRDWFINSDTGRLEQDPRAGQPAVTTPHPSRPDERPRPAKGKTRGHTRPPTGPLPCPRPEPITDTPTHIDLHAQPPRS